MAITYVLGKSGSGKIFVHLDGRNVGTISRTRGGDWFYKPKGGGRGADFPTLEACKASLEGR